MQRLMETAAAAAADAGGQMNSKLLFYSVSELLRKGKIQAEIYGNGNHLDTY